MLNPVYIPFPTLGNIRNVPPSASEGTHSLPTRSSQRPTAPTSMSQSWSAPRLWPISCATESVSCQLATLFSSLFCEFVSPAFCANLTGSEIGSRGGGEGGQCADKNIQPKNKYLKRQKLRNDTPRQVCDHTRRRGHQNRALAPVPPHRARHRMVSE